MEIINTILKILPFLVPLLLLGAWYQNVKNKKLDIEEEPSKLKEWFKTTQIYTIFIYRAGLRPSSLFFYWIFVFTAFLVFMAGITFLNLRPHVYLEDIKPVEGYITKVVWIKAGKGGDYIKLKTDNGTEEVYLLLLDEERVEFLNNVKGKVTVYPYERYYINIFQTKHIVDLKYKNKFLVGYFAKEGFGKDKNKKKLNVKIIYNFFYNTWFGLKIALIGLFFIFLLNYEEKPIHRLNRMRKYLKNKEECQVQSKNTPKCSAKVHHFVTPI